MTKSLPARFGLACSLAAGLLLSAGASAQEGVAVKSILGKMGIIPEDKDPIRYRERAPLALPPKGAQLREPLPTTDYATTNPQWPQDPDVVERRRRNAEANLPVGESEIRRMSENNPRLSQEELRRGRIAANPRVTPGARGDSARDVLYLSPDELAAGRRSGTDDDERDAGPQRRRTLAEPPTDLRRSASGKRIDAVASTPRGDQQAIDANPLNWFTSKFTKRDDDE